MSDALVFYEDAVQAVLDSNKHVLNLVSYEIWIHPETLFEEVFAHDLLTNFLQERDFSVTRHYGGLKTAFRAEFSSANYNKDVHATIAIICEYDALPDIGHACGHNLIAEAGAAAGLAVQETLRNLRTTNDVKHVEGRVVVLGTPAEEGGVGKVHLINAGAFDDIDFAMMVHPFPYNDLEPIILGIEHGRATFYRKTAYLRGGAWENVNPLDAVVASYQSISLFRQQMKPTWRVHCVIANGGMHPDVVPDLAVIEFYTRAQSQVDLRFLKQKVTEVLRSAAESTGCAVNIEWSPIAGAGMLHNSTMSRIYKKHSSANGVVFPDNVPGFFGSTDMGNVSLVVPSIHPGFSLGQESMIHTKDFQKLAGCEQAQTFTLFAAKTMALTCIELLLNKELRDQAKEEFITNRDKFI